MTDLARLQTKEGICTYLGGISAVLGWTLKTVSEMLDRYQSMTASQSDSAVTKLEAHR